MNINDEISVQNLSSHLKKIYTGSPNQKMECRSSIFVFVAIFACASVQSASIENPRIISRSLAPIDKQGQYLAGWTTDLDAKGISFKLIVETTGFVGFGLSPSGGMKGADIIIGGIFDETGKPYFQDRHARGWGEPTLDKNQNCQLNLAVQNGTHTHLEFSRLLDTGDAEQDVVIRNENTTVIWTFGTADALQYHWSNRGAYVTNLLSN